MESKVGDAFHAIVGGVEDFGLFCRLVEFPVEGLIHVTSLADDFYYLEAGTHALVGRRSGVRHRLGDRIEVRIAHVDVDRRQLDLVLASTPLSKSRAPSRKHYYPATAPSRPPRAKAEGDAEPGAHASQRPRRPAADRKKPKPRPAKKRKRS
jgi:ribonuclease R